MFFSRLTNHNYYMKIKLLFVFLVLSLFSCSDDDSQSNSGNKKLDKIVTTSYNDNGSKAGYYVLYFDDQNRMVSNIQYDISNTVMNKTESAYGQYGLSVVTIYNIDSSIPYYTFNYTYDNEGKLAAIETISKEFGQETSSTETFTYNNDNTISRNVGNWQYLFYKDSSGRIFKMTENDHVSEVVYEGENVTSYIVDDKTTTYTFDDIHLPKGDHHKLIINQFNGNMQNVILSGGLPSVTFGISKYVVAQSTTSGSDVTYNYQFDSAGYPVKILTKLAGENYPSQIREIIYK